MKESIVIGCPGSGKTTFAEKLNKQTGLPRGCAKLSSVPFGQYAY